LLFVLVSLGIGYHPGKTEVDIKVIDRVNNLLRRRLSRGEDGTFRTGRNSTLMAILYQCLFRQAVTSMWRRGGTQISVRGQVRH
jgi:hypothetical protein